MFMPVFISQGIGGKTEMIHWLCSLPSFQEQVVGAGRMSCLLLRTEAACKIDKVSSELSAVEWPFGALVAISTNDDELSHGLIVLSSLPARLAKKWLKRASVVSSVIHWELNQKHRYCCCRSKSGYLP